MSAPGTIEHALELMILAHQEQKDKRGEPYVLHPLGVLALLDTYGLSPMQVREAQIVALLHDAIEDSPHSAAAIKNGEFSHNVMVALDSVTRRDGEPYFTYVRRAKLNPVGRRVKIADLTHTLSNDRRTGDPREEERRIKYNAALKILRESDRTPT